MRRMLRHVALVLVALLVVDWAPGLPPLPLNGVAQVRAQPNFFPNPIAPGGIIADSNASVSVTNTTTETSVWQWVVTPSLIASASSVAAIGTPIYTGGTASGLSGAPLFTTPAPLHLRMVGLLAGSAGTTVNLGVNFGTITGGTQGAATLTLNNNIVGAITTPTPIYVDVWLSALATTTATPNQVNSVVMFARSMYVNASGTFTVVNSATIAAVNIASPSTMNVVARWAAAASTSALSFYNRVLVIGQ